ncbi:hypothetical protein J6590_028379 [Homalodisca vitripennis]|nr:hypothetical protein J6590_028379 [Homalodisca vitripennis]
MVVLEETHRGTEWWWQVHDSPARGNSSREGEERRDCQGGEGGDAVTSWCIAPTGVGTCTDCGTREVAGRLGCWLGGFGCKWLGGNRIGPINPKFVKISNPRSRLECIGLKERMRLSLVEARCWERVSGSDVTADTSDQRLHVCAAISITDLTNRPASEPRVPELTTITF